MDLRAKKRAKKQHSPQDCASIASLACHGLEVSPMGTGGDHWPAPASHSGQDRSSLFTSSTLSRAGAAGHASCQTSAPEGLQSWTSSTSTPAVSLGALGISDQSIPALPPSLCRCIQERVGEVCVSRAESRLSSCRDVQHRWALCTQVDLPACSNR